MDKEFDIFKNLESVERKINIVRRCILELNNTLNLTRKWGMASNEQWDKMSKSDKERLEELSIDIFKDIINAENEVTKAKMIIFKGTESVVADELYKILLVNWHRYNKE